MFLTGVILRRMLEPAPTDPAAFLPSTRKWGAAAQAGFQILPDILLKQQNELGLSATELVVLINLTMHWWYPEQMPFPRSTTIAKRMGLDVRTVQRAMNRLQRLRLIEKKKVKEEGDELTVFDLTGLVQQLGLHARHDTSYRARRAGKAEQAAGPVPT